MKNVLLLSACCLIVVYIIINAAAIKKNLQPKASHHLENTSALEGEEKPEADIANTLAHTNAAYLYAKAHGMNTRFCLLADMGLASGKNRLFVYDFSAGKIEAAMLVAHGSCNTSFLRQARFSNDAGCGCSAYGKYKIGGKYKGRFGIAYKLYGLDSSNSNAFLRNIVLHSYYAVPDKEVYPAPISNSLGCIMISENSLKQLSKKIDAGSRPTLLWVYE